MRGVVLAPALGCWMLAACDCSAHCAGAECDGSADCTGTECDGAVGPPDGAPYDAGPATGAPSAVITITPERIARDDGYSTVVEIDGRSSTGGGLRFEWSVPDGMLVDGSRPTDPAIRVTFPGTVDHEVLLRVENDLGGDLAVGTVRVNRPPRAHVDGGGVVTAGEAVTLDASGSSDPDGDELTYTWSLTRAPDASIATIEGGESASFTPDVAGSYVVTLVVGDGLSDSPPVEVPLFATAPETNPPSVHVTATPLVVDVGASSRVCVTASDDTSIAAVRALVDGAELPLGADGCGEARAEAVARYEVTGIAVDAWGTEARAYTEFFGRAATDDGPPTVALASPADGAALDRITDAIGTASDSDLTHYRLEARPAGDGGGYTTLLEGTEPVTDGSLGLVEPGRLLPGTYEVRLCAVDSHAQERCTATRFWTFEGGEAAGFLRLRFTDARLDDVGLPIVVYRTYDSRDLRSHDFGHGWMLELEGFGEFSAPEDPGTGWSESGCLSLPFRPTYTALYPHVFEVHAGRNRYRFAMRLEGTACGPTGGSQANVVFDPLEGSAGTFEVLGADATDCFFNRSEGRLYNGDLITPWSPTGYRLTLPDGTRYEMSRTEITSITSPSGRVIRFEGGRVISDAGTIEMSRDAAGRITELRAGERVRTYGYDGRGDLVSTVAPGGAETRFVYDHAHRLQGIVDPRGGVPGMMEYDEDGRVVAIVDSSGRRIEITHDVGARQEVITDRLGNTYIYYYDDAGNVVRRIDAEGHERRWTWDEDGKLLSEVDENGNTTSYEYDAAGNRTAIVDAEGGRWETAYDAAGRPTSTTDPLGHRRVTEYGPGGEITALIDATGARTTLGYTDGALTSVSLPEGGTMTLARDAAGRMTSSTDALGRVVNVTYDAAGNPTATSSTVTVGGADTAIDFAYEHDARGVLTAVTAPDGTRSSVTYDEAGRPVSATTADGSGQALEYDVGGHVTGITGPSGEHFGITYDAEARPVALSLPNGAVVSTERDANGRVRRATFPGGVSLTYERDPTGRVSSVTDAMGRTTRYGYDRTGRVTSVERPDGTTLLYERDRAGRLTAITDPARGRTGVVYDEEGRPTEITSPGGGRTTAEYDAAGRPTRVVAPSGRTLEYDYDLVGQLTGVRDGSGNTTTYTYNGAGDLERIETAAGIRWEFGRDESGRLLSRSGGPREAAERYVYDDAGRTSQITDATGTVVDLAYDPTGRLVSRTGGALTETRSYDAAGRLRSVRAATGTTMLVYDAAGRVARVTDDGGRFVSYAYDPSGLPTSVGGLGGTARYEWTASGRLSAVEDPSGGRTTYRYDDAGRITAVTLPNGVEVAYTYDAAGRVTRIQHGGLLDESYTYDAAGRLVRIDSGGEAISFTYDEAGRLASETRGGTTTEYLYDADGNLVQRGDTALQYDAHGRLTRFGSDAVTWDAAGRMTSREVDGVTESYTYDAFGRLSRITRDRGTPSTIELAYGGDDLLERVTVDGEVRHLVWDRTGPIPLLLEEVAGDGTVLARYTWGAGGPIAVTRPGGTRYLHTDARRSVRVQSDGTGAAVATADYDATGVPAGAPLEGLGFAGEWRIPGTDLIYLRARVLEPRSGRFLTPDPASADLREPLSLNPYLYASGDPVNRFDPTGRFSVAQMNVALGVIQVLATIALSAYDSPEALVADALGVRDILRGGATLQGVTAQVGAEGLLGGGRGNAGTWTRMVGVSAFLGVDAYFSPPTLALWISLGAYIQLGGAGRGLGGTMKGGFIVGKEEPVSAGFEAKAVSGTRIILWVSSRYILGALRPAGGSRFSQIIRFIQGHVHGVELSLKPGLDLAIRANLGAAQTTRRWRSFRIGFELKWVFFALDGQGVVGSYPWEWSDEQWRDLFRRFGA